MPQNIDKLTEQIRTLLPLVKEVQVQNTEQQLIKQEIKNLKKYKIGDDKISELELKLSKDQAKYDKGIQKQFTETELENEKQFGIFRNKMVFYAIIEKVIVAVIIAYLIKGQ